jgi:hypothetical protein
VTYLIAAPGTRVGDPGWHKIPPGLVLRWDAKGTMPAFAVQRDGVLLATGHITSCAHCGAPSTVPYRHVCRQAIYDWLSKGIEYHAPSLVLLIAEDMLREQGRAYAV